ncbi:hypothetical protein BV20DRAFT_1042476 [Pilatotrama ljubarskyi]|nr:hypothetical protein BV20DRAFT_1042476 [Pilatotrama ljubarskyi]
MSALGTTSATIELVPAPRTVKAEAWWFITSFGHRPEPGETLPIGYFPSQEKHLYKVSTAQDAFCGGRGFITLIRYTESPIGPFDELAIAPGEFANPYDRQSHRITRAYASSLKAVVNGRHNWGIPRELAEFAFTPSLEDPDSTEVRVYPATSFSPIEYASTPCFAALVKHISWLLAIPTSLAHYPQVKLCQPPLEASPEFPLDGLVGTTKWHLLDRSESRGRAKPFRHEGLLPPVEQAPNSDLPADKKAARRRVADGVGFPDVHPYSIGVHWTELSMTLPQAVPLAAL